ncbi:hypothetical protein E4U56_001884 [Claviceps arundinis]|uniref:Thioester reductase (TE) domain-containing protein n=1 Tax=Claviceps arundinis TaxID=1623583 RepID=A0A9P7MQU8_9HYPO|nr:hypothetical protein E4U56_001884 [Claviceps arundinis]
MIAQIQAHFETEANYELFEGQWDELTFHKVFNENPDKSLEQNVSLLVAKLEKLFAGLFLPAQRDTKLRNKLKKAMAASGVSQVTQVRPPKTYEAILAEYKNCFKVKARNCFKLDETHWRRLADRTTITAIIHNGASVHWLKRYADLEATNVGATATASSEELPSWNRDPSAEAEEPATADVAAKAMHWSIPTDDEDSRGEFSCNIQVRGSGNCDH